MPFSHDQHKNLAYSTVAIAPSPALSGTSLTVTTGEGGRFPAVPFNATVWAAGEVPTPANAEIVRVTGTTGSNTFTITRTQEGTSARQITVGDQIAATITGKTLTDVEDTLSDLISAHDRLSNTVSGLAGGGASVTSTEVSAVSAQAASADSVIRVSINAISNLISAASVRSAGGISTHGLQSVLNALSNRISLAGAGGVSVTSNELSAASAQAQSAINVVSNAVSIVSQALSVLSQANSAAHVSLEVHASAASAAATSVDARVNTLSQAISVISQQVSVLSQRVSVVVSGVSALSTGGISTHGIQSIINALSNRISLAGAGGVSVTSTELSAVSAQAQSAINVVSQGVSVLSQQVSVLSQQVSVLSQGLSVVSQALSNEISNRISADNVLSQAISVISQQVSVLSQAHSVLSQAHSVLSNIVSGVVSGASVRSVGNVSTHGFQSILDALSTRISAGGGGAGSVTSTELSAVSANAAQGISVVSQALSVETAARISVDNVISNQASIANQGVSILSQQVSVLSQALSALSSLVSNLISATSSDSTKLSNLVSVVDALSNRVSALPGGTSVASVHFISSGDQVVSATTLTNVSGLSISVSAGGIYRLEAMVMFNRGLSITPTRWGLTFPAMKKTRGRIYIPYAISAVGGTNFSYVGHWAGDSASGSLIINQALSTPGAVSAIAYYDGIFVVSTTGVIQIQTAASTTTSQITLINGSYIKVFKLK